LFCATRSRQNKIEVNRIKANTIEKTRLRFIVRHLLNFVTFVSRRDMSTSVSVIFAGSKQADENVSCPGRGIDNRCAHLNSLAGRDDYPAP
jgi:hypothetical protein